ncbi:MAG: Holliday junction branch migration protein RuvA [Bacteroidales bacterium]|nr:Holliday junction branch migration protein RuvA [Bacteroidales bacterium]
MIEYIKGEVTELTPTSAVIECNGVGYLLNISLNSFSALSVGKGSKLFAYEVIREDSQTLFGFTERQERELFLLLISVSGVGPNTARMILSSFSVAELEGVISSGNDKLLKNVKGIGAKTAQRIIVDLKDKIKPGSVTLNTTAAINQEVSEEALSALVMLGFPQNVSQKCVNKILSDNPSCKVEEVIKAALKML